MLEIPIALRLPQALVVSSSRWTWVTSLTAVMPVRQEELPTAATIRSSRAGMTPWQVRGRMTQSSILVAPKFRVQLVLNRFPDMLPRLLWMTLVTMEEPKRTRVRVVPNSSPTLMSARLNTPWVKKFG